jgi:3-(3-hydroxy-phenyl)propionate hydroxylase
VDVHFSRGLAGFVADHRGVTVTTDDGDEVRGEWLIGADGAGSRVRACLGLPYEGRTYEHASVLVTTDFRFEDHLDGLANVAYCWSAHGPFSLLRLPDCWRVSLYPDAGDDLETLQKTERLRPVLARIHPDARHARLLGVNPYRVQERCVPRFREGRVLLAGDAAHLNAPSGGMGMNGGIHDAMNLVEKLLRVIGGEPDDLLDRYSRQRRHLAAGAIIPQAADNRLRMQTRDPAEQEQKLSYFEEIAKDEERCRQFLLRSSMIAGLREAERVS